MQILDTINLWLVEAIIIAVITLAIIIFILLVSRMEKLARTALRRAADDKKLAENAIKTARDIAAIAGQSHLCACLNEIEGRLDGLFKRIFYLHTAILKKGGFLTARPKAKEILLVGLQMTETAAEAQQASKDVIKNAQKARHDKTTSIIMKARSLVDTVAELGRKARLIANEEIIVISSFSEMALELCDNIEGLLPQLRPPLKALVERAPTAATAQLAQDLAAMEIIAQPAFTHWESINTMRNFAYEEKEEAAQILITVPSLVSTVRQLAAALEPYRGHNAPLFRDIDKCTADADWLAGNIKEAVKAREMPQGRQWLEQLYDIEEWLRKTASR